MNKEKKEEMILMNFSGIYKEEEFWKKREVSWIEAQDIPSTNCYCDAEAFEEITRRIEALPVQAVHFIDSGNYHYMTRLWIEKIKHPFQMLVFDNHTDMQPPAFGGLLSCGGWIAASLDEVETLRHVILIGPDEEAYSQTEERYREKVTFLSREKLRMMTQEQIKEFLGNALDKEAFPLYISIDKDILCQEDARTTWSQGDMHLNTMLSCVQMILDGVKEDRIRLEGVDICGEADSEILHDNTQNEKANEKLAELFYENSVFKQI